MQQCACSHLSRPSSCTATWASRTAVLLGIKIIRMFRRLWLQSVTLEMRKVVTLRRLGLAGTEMQKMILMQEYNMWLLMASISIIVQETSNATAVRLRHSFINQRIVLAKLIRRKQRCMDPFHKIGKSYLMVDDRRLSGMTDLLM